MVSALKMSLVSNWIFLCIIICSAVFVQNCRWMNCFRLDPPHSVNCYCIVAEKKTWHAAREYCSSRRMRLLMIESSSEERMLTKVLEGRGYKDVEKGRFWTAGTDNEREGIWKWASRDEIGFNHDILFENWCPGEPNNFNGNEHYILKLWTNPSLFKIESCWYDAPAEWQNYFICEDGPQYF